LYHDMKPANRAIAKNWLVSVQTLHLVRFLAFSDGGVVW